MDMVFKQAIEYCASDLKTLTKAMGKRQVYSNTALLKDGSLDRLSEVLEYPGFIAPHSDYRLQSTYGRLQSNISQKESITLASISSHGEYHNLETLLNALCFHWMDTDKTKESQPKFLEPFYEQAEARGYYWLAIEAVELLSQVIPYSHYGEHATALCHDSNIQTLVDLTQLHKP